MTYHIDVGTDPVGNMTRLNNVLGGIEGKLDKAKEQLANTETQLETAKVEVIKPFKQEEELDQKLDRLNELNALLNMDETGADEVEETNELGDSQEESDKVVVTSIFDRIAKKESLIEAKKKDEKSSDIQKKDPEINDKKNQQAI